MGTNVSHLLESRRLVGTIAKIRIRAHATHGPGLCWQDCSENSESEQVFFEWISKESL